MRKIRIAQIGMNQYSHCVQIFKSIAGQSDVFEVAGCVLPENERERLPKRVANLDGYREMTLDEVLNDPEIEAVTVETDELYLTKYALLAAQAGKHVHMEKPGGADLAEFEQLIAAIKASGKVFSVGYMYRFNPFIQELMRRVKDGELGEIVSVEAQMNCIHPPKKRQWLSCLPGGMTFHLGCHLLDLVLQLQGMPKAVIPLNKCSGADGVTSTDFGMAVLEYEHGVSFIKASSVELGGYARRQLVVSGTKGTVELKPLESRAGGIIIYTTKTEYSSSDWDDMGQTEKTDPLNRYDAMLRHFANCILEGMENPYTPDYELELYKTLLKCCGSEKAFL